MRYFRPGCDQLVFLSVVRPKAVFGTFDRGASISLSRNFDEWCDQWRIKKCFPNGVIFEKYAHMCGVHVRLAAALSTCAQIFGRFHRRYFLKIGCSIFFGQMRAEPHYVVCTYRNECRLRYDVAVEEKRRKPSSLRRACGGSRPIRFSGGGLITAAYLLFFFRTSFFLVHKLFLNKNRRYAYRIKLKIARENDNIGTGRLIR